MSIHRDLARARAEDSLWGEFDSMLRPRIAAWLARRCPAEAEDLTQEVALQLVRAARRLGVALARDLERLAWKIARDVVAENVRRRRRQVGAVGLEDGPCSYESQGAVARSSGAEGRLRDRAALRELREAIERRAGPRQRRLLAAYLDHDVVTISGLARHLGTDRKRIREMLRGLRRIVVDLRRADAGRRAGGGSSETSET